MEFEGFFVPDVEKEQLPNAILEPWSTQTHLLQTCPFLYWSKEVRDRPLLLAGPCAASHDSLYTCARRLGLPHQSRNPDGAGRLVVRDGKVSDIFWRSIGFNINTSALLFVRIGKALGINPSILAEAEHIYSLPSLLVRHRIADGPDWQSLQSDADRWLLIDKYIHEAKREADQREAANRKQ